MVTVLSEHGYTLPGVVVEGRTVESDWSTDPYGNRDRILVRVDRKSAKHYKIELRHQTELPVDGSMTLKSDPPDTMLEWHQGGRLRDR